MDERYRTLIGLHQQNCIYDSYVVDSCRIVITRWRLSNFELAVETGRYRRPIIERERRVCKTCLVMEDESHVFFRCPLYNEIRAMHPNVFGEASTVTTILNPTSRELLYETAHALFEIEKTHTKYNAWWICMMAEGIETNVELCWLNVATVGIGCMMWIYCLIMLSRFVYIWW